MKKLLALLLSLCLVAALCAGCGSTPTPAEDDSTTTTPEEPVTVRLGGLKGPTSMGMVKLLSDNDAGKTTNHYDFPWLVPQMTHPQNAPGGTGHSGRPCQLGLRPL